ncbi:hypothetical protein KKG31_04215 [Patescibacteria group bacterium]|nr:hypothetical protein [Patescibacteria group bacterium]MBU1758346.1 hypothetical protein [Patescibacteria group bacterium]
MGKVTPLITQRAKSLPIVPSTTGERGYGITSLLEAKRQAQKKLLEDGLKIKSE